MGRFLDLAVLRTDAPSPPEEKTVKLVFRDEIESAADFMTNLGNLATAHPGSACRVLSEFL